MNKNETNNFVNLYNDYYYFVSSLQDEHELIKIENKSPSLKDTNIGKIVCGDTNSNILTFEIARFYDGMDLSTKGIQFLVKVGDRVSVESASNVQFSNDLIRFSWVMSYFATSGKSVTVAIEFYGDADGRDYSLKTTPFTVSVENSLDVNTPNAGFISDDPENYLVNLSNRLIRLEEKINGLNDNSFATLQDISTAMENMEFENEPIDFSQLTEGTNSEETN